MATKKEIEARRILSERWSKFIARRQEILDQRASERRLSERDVESIFEALASGPLNYKGGQIARQQDFADYALIDRGLKLAVVEIKNYQAFQNFERLDDALIQAARYADRHRTPNLIAFDGEMMILARRHSDAINIILEVDIDKQEAPEELYYFGHYGLFRYPKETKRIISYQAEQDEKLYRRHHGVLLYYSCFAYVGDLRDKQTWLMPYRNPDGSVDTRRIGHAVNYLLSPGGYRGRKAKNEKIPPAATGLCALRLARAYKEIGKWEEVEDIFQKASKPSPQAILWTYLYQHGIEIEDI